MSFLARKFIFVPGEDILAEEWAAELNQLYRFFESSDAGQAIFSQNSANPVLILENIRAGQVILEIRKNNNIVVQLLGTQQLQSYITNIAPILVDSTTKVVNLNAQYLNGLDSSKFFTNGRKCTFYADFIFPFGIGVGNKANVYVVPDGTNVGVTEFKCQIKTDPLYDSCSINLELRKNGVNITTVSLTDVNTSATQSLGTSVVGGDLISLEIVFVDLGIGVAPHDLTAQIKLVQDLIT
jgi:hypothetical protein